MSKNSCFEHGEVHKVLLLIVLSSIERKGEREVHKRVNESLRVRVSVRALFGERALLRTPNRGGQDGRGRGKGTKRTRLLFAWPATVEREPAPDSSPLRGFGNGGGDPGCLHWGFAARPAGGKGIKCRDCA